MTSPPQKKIKVFFSYSHSDEKLKDKLVEHLSVLKRQNIISEWTDRQITAGSNFSGEISNSLDEADIVLLLISSSFLASDYCYNREMQRALERHEKGEARVIPIILRPCDWHDAPFGKLLALPKDGKPVTRWNNIDDAFLDIAKEIRRISEGIKAVNIETNFEVIDIAKTSEEFIAQLEHWKEEFFEDVVPFLNNAQRGEIAFELWKKDFSIIYKRYITSEFSAFQMKMLNISVLINYDTSYDQFIKENGADLITLINDLIESILKKQQEFNEQKSTIQPISKQSKRITISVECEDIVEFKCDVLILKYAQEFFGSDALIAHMMSLDNINPRPGAYELLPSSNKIRAGNILFVGVLPLYQFDYHQIREFAKYALQVLQQKMPNIEHLAMTIHGVGYGLDERESFTFQIAGIIEAIRENAFPPSLLRITILERNQSRASRLKEILDQIISSENMSEETTLVQTVPLPDVIIAKQQTNVKPHIFVAMPFSDEMEDVYTFGIQSPVNASGFLCERVDMATFTGDILTRIKSRIDTAALVVADLTGANPNVYLEVGYAWGKQRPTLLVTKQGNELMFDVRGQKCITYKNIADLARKLEIDLNTLKGEEP